MATFPASSPSPERTSARVFNTWRRGFIAYARWLDSISWKRFFVLSLLALIVASILGDLPPFNITWGGNRSRVAANSSKNRVPDPPVVITESSKSDGKNPGTSYEIKIDKNGVRIVPSQPAPAPSASAPAPPTAPVPPEPPASSALSEGVTIKLPANADTEEVRRAIREAQAEIEEAIRESREAAKEAEQEARQAARDAAREAAKDAARNASKEARAASKSITEAGFTPGDHMPPFMFFLIVLSAVTKLMATGRFKAEAQAVVATEMAESEALKRQVIEARMAAMQAQVEPHFLFNTLASIDHLIETDPPRASRMQKNLIALLRASMPTMREANAQGTRDLGRELAVIRPYLEILKVRMEERLVTDIRVSDGLLSAEFPPMMLQSLVENAIKHGLEPKAEGGSLTVSAEILHGKLAVTVADTGLGFGKAATAGTGIGLNNIRERLQLLYGNKASLTVAENPGGGTAVTITVPYRSQPGADA